MSSARRHPWTAQGSPPRPTRPSRPLPHGSGWLSSATHRPRRLTPGLPLTCLTLLSPSLGPEAPLPQLPRSRGPALLSYACLGLNLWGCSRPPGSPSSSRPGPPAVGPRARCLPSPPAVCAPPLLPPPTRIAAFPPPAVPLGLARRAASPPRLRRDLLSPWSSPARVLRRV